MSDPQPGKSEQRPVARGFEVIRNGQQVSTPVPGHEGGRGQLDAVYLAPGREVFAGFRLVERIGRGHSGEIWRATRPDGAVVALCCVDLGRPGARVKLRAIGQTMSIRHPHLIASFGPWERVGWVGIGMDLAEGSILDQFDAARNAGRSGLEAAELFDLLGQAAEGIDYLNEPRHAWNNQPPASLVHRDIKPANLFRFGATIKVGDFSLAQRIEPDGATRLHPFEVGRHCPLTGYSAPELRRGLVSLRSDQYSLAASYYHLRGGSVPEVPTEGADPLDLTTLVAAERAAVARALASDPDERWPSCAAFLAALKATTRPIISITTRIEPASLERWLAEEISVEPEVIPPTVPLGVVGPRFLNPATAREVAKVRLGPGQTAQADVLCSVAAGAVEAHAAELPDPDPILIIPPQPIRPAQPDPTWSDPPATGVATLERSWRRSPLLVAGLVAAISVVMVWFGLVETLPQSSTNPSGGNLSIVIKAASKPSQPSARARVAHADFAPAVAAHRVVPSQPAAVVKTPAPASVIPQTAVPAGPPPLIAQAKPPQTVPPVDLVLDSSKQDVEPHAAAPVAAPVPAVEQHQPMVAAAPTTPEQPTGLPEPAPAPAPVPLVASHLVEPVSVIEPPVPGPTSAEIAVAFQSWVGAKLDRLTARISLIRTAGRAWIDSLPRPAVPAPRREVGSVPVGPRSATILVRLPTAKAELLVRGEVGRGNPDEWYGPTRVIHSPPMTVAQEYLVGAFWTDQSGRIATRSQPLRVEPGRRYEVDLRNDQPSVVEVNRSPDP